MRLRGIPPSPVRRESGIALLLVIILLAALATLAVPFASSMRQQSVAARRFRADAEARFIAQAATDWAAGHLAQSNEPVEVAESLDPSSLSPMRTPYSDAEWEPYINLAEPTLAGFTVAEALGAVRDQDGKQTVVTVAVEDESGKVDLNSASPWLIGGLFGATVTTERADSGDGTLEVEDTSFFPSSGYLFVRGEVIEYSGKSDLRFTGLSRGSRLGWGFESRTPQRIGEGSLVIDARAYVLSKQHLFVDEQDATLPLLTISEARSSALVGTGAGTFHAAELEPLMGDMTVDSGRTLAAGWFAGQPLVAEPEQDDSGGWTLPVRSPIHYGMGSVVRVTSNGRRYHGHVIGFRFDSAANSLVPVVDVPLDDVTDSDGAFAEVEERAPVNINSASQRVLIACLLGVSINPKDSVSFDEAYDLATTIIATRRDDDHPDGITGLADLRQILATCPSTTLSANDRNAIFLNAQAPDHVTLRVGTAPFSFRSADRYTVDTAVRILGPGDRTEGEHRQRETMLACWPAPQVWSIDSQRDFRSFVERFGWMNWMTTGPATLEYEAPTPERAVYTHIPYEVNRYPSESRDLGVVSLVPSREWDGESDQVMLQHFAGSQGDAHQIEQTGYALPLANLFAPKPGTGARVLAPGRVEFWIRPDQWGSGDRAYLIDMGENYYQNRFSLYYEPSYDRLVFRMSDSTAGIVPDPTTGEVIPAWAEVRFPMERNGLELGKWHHVAVEWGGTLYGEMALLVDGVQHIRGQGGPLGDPGDPPDTRVGFTYATDDPGMSPLTFLSSAIDESSETIEVEDASAFPPRGSLEIGGEVVLYDNSQGGGTGSSLTIVPENRQTKLQQLWWDTSETPTRIFIAAQRGLNRTRASAHEVGEPVTPAGYSAGLVAWLPPEGAPPTPGGLPAPGGEGEETPPLPGGAEGTLQNQSWDGYADPWWYDHSGEMGTIAPTNGIVQDLDPVFGRRAIYSGGAMIDGTDYSNGVGVGKGGNLALPYAYCLDDDARAQMSQGAGFTIPDPSELDPSGEDEVDWMRLFMPMFTGCEVNPAFPPGSDDITLLSTDATDFTPVTTTGSWPLEGYAVLMRVSWQGGGMMGGRMGGGGPMAGMCIPWIDAFRSVFGGVAGQIGGEMGMPPGMGGSEKPYQYVRYTMEQGIGGLTLLERGLFGTEPLEVTFNPAETPYREVWAFPISVTARWNGPGEVYEAYPATGYIQIEDEWIEYYFYRYDSGRGVIEFITPVWEKIIDSIVGAAREAMSGGQFNPGMVANMGSLISSIIGTNRGQASTMSMPHPRPGGGSSVSTGVGGSPERMVIPAFQVRGDVGQPWDIVTVVDDYDPDLDIGGVPMVGSVHWRYVRPGESERTWIAFDSEPPRGALSGGRSRVVKFPSGDPPELYTNSPAVAGGGPNQPAGGVSKIGAGGVLGSSPISLATTTLIASGDPAMGGVSYAPLDLGALAGVPEVNTGGETHSASGWIDEVRVRSKAVWQSGAAGSGMGRLVVRIRGGDPEADNGEPIAADSEIVVVDASIGQLAALGMDTDGGILKCGDELIAFRSAAALTDTTTELSGCQRAFLSQWSNQGGGGRVLGDGQPAMLLTYADMTQLDQGMGLGDASVPVLSSKDLRPVDGFVLIEDEIVGYTRAGSTLLEMPRRLDEDDGLYRARFGTRADSHAFGAIVYELPFRYWDRYAERADDPTMGYIQVARSQPEADWLRFAWEEEVPGSYLDLVCLLRTGGSPNWTEEPEGGAGGIWLFEDPRETGVSLPPTSQLELRFMMRYLPGAYENSHDWKDTPLLKSVYAEFRGRPMILSHEEIR